MLLPQRLAQIHSTGLLQAKGIQFERQIFCSKLVPHYQEALQGVLPTPLILFHIHFGTLSKKTFYLMNMTYIWLRIMTNIVGLSFIL
jgi:hypothetical protein